jgi:collagen type I/II/III/V/XI/XXIV/XXVII alpha
LATIRALRQGWSKQELANFHRVANALWEAGLSVETDSGVSDEGERWFAFCDVDAGEVVAHFARIGGKYIVCAPFLNGSLTGSVFSDLIERFLDRCPGGRAASLGSHSPPAA